METQHDESVWMDMEPTCSTLVNESKDATAAAGSDSDSDEESTAELTAFLSSIFLKQEDDDETSTICSRLIRHFKKMMLPDNSGELHKFELKHKALILMVTDKMCKTCETCQTNIRLFMRLKGDISNGKHTQALRILIQYFEALLDPEESSIRVTYD